MRIVRTETWLPAAGYDGRYEVSNRGRIRTVDFRGTGKYRMLKPNVVSIGYHQYNLTRDGVAKKRNIHIVVAETFIGPRPAGCVINHKDGNPGNNCATNLEYCTQKENVMHAYRTGLVPSRKGERNGNSKITDCMALEMRRLRLDGYPYRVLAQMLSLSETTVWNVLHRPANHPCWSKE